jgi:translation initiation factor 2B subunit (eIF-2B alpha/beta/delta family)
MAKLRDAPGWGKLASGPSSQPKCQKCGKPLKDPKYKLCYECNQKARSEQAEGGKSLALPASCVFQSFYDDRGHLRRQIFIEAARELSDLFMKANISQTSIRNLFNLLKDMANRLQADRNLDFGIAQETFYRFVRQVEYNVKRQVLNPIFQEFAERHLNVSTKDRKEFMGFVEYLTSIVARLKSK